MAINGWLDQAVTDHSDHLDETTNALSYHCYARGASNVH